MPSRRERSTSAVGPDGSGSKPGMECTQMPERSGMDAALSLPLLGATGCPKAGVAAAAATVNAARKSRHCEFMLSSLFMGFRQQLSDKLPPLGVRVEGGPYVNRNIQAAPRYSRHRGASQIDTHSRPDGPRAALITSRIR